MKKVLPLVPIMLFMVSFLCSGQVPEYSPDSKPASTNVQDAQYPRVTSDLRAIFRIRAPEARKVQINPGKTYNMVKVDERFRIVTIESTKFLQ